MIVNCTQLHYTRFRLKQLIRHRFFKGEFSKSIHRKSTKSQKIATKTQLKIWNTFVPNNTTTSFLIVVVKDFLSRNKILFLISHLSCTLKLSILNLEWKNQYFWKFQIRRYWQYNSENSLYNFKWCIIQLQNNFALHSAQWSMVLRLIGLLEQTPHFFVNEILKFRPAMVINLVQVFIHLFGKNIALLVSLQETYPLHL